MRAMDSVSIIYTAYCGNNRSADMKLQIIVGLVVLIFGALSLFYLRDLIGLAKANLIGSGVFLSCSMIVSNLMLK